jgi:transposase
MKFTPPVVEVTEEKALHAANTLQAMINGGHPESETLRLSLFAICTYVKIIHLLSQRGMGVALLRRLLGLALPAEEEKAGPEPKPKKERKQKRGGGHGKRPANAFLQAIHRFFAHPDFNEPGALCGECNKGGVYPHFGQWHRFMGQTMLKVVIINYEIWRCTLCGAAWPAPIAADITEDGPERKAFGFSATALIVIAKYFYGTPWARQERMQSMQGLPVSASCMNDQTHGFALIITPIYECMIRMAAQGWRFFSDDTGFKILELKALIKKQRKTEKETLRTGVHTSVIRADLAGSITIALFKSGIQHAGEFIDEVLAFRDPGLPTPLHMMDGSSCSPATVCETNQCHCNSHARRKLEEKAELYPEHWEVVRQIYRDIYAGDAEIKHTMSPEERLKYHQDHSKQAMLDMFAWMQKELDDKNVEPNSTLGGIFAYFLARQKSLMAFTEFAGAPLDNNPVEQLIKFVALIRKNSNYYRTLVGANDSDKILTVGVTVGLSGANLNTYFTAVQRYSAEVKKNPELFLPWNYEATIKRLETESAVKASPPRRVREITREQWQVRQEAIRIQRQNRNNARKKAKSANELDPPAYTSTA